MTVFASHCGLYQLWVLLFGLCNAPVPFQWLMQSVLAELVHKICAVYQDVVVVPMLDEHVKNLRPVLLWLQEAGLKLKDERCKFLRGELIFLGKHGHTGGSKARPRKIHGPGGLPNTHIPTIIAINSWAWQATIGSLCTISPASPDC